MTKKKAVCLLSGGLDSCVTTFLAKQQGYEIYGLSFRYGQRHTKELSCAKKIAKKIGAKDHIIFTVNLSRFGGSSLLSTSTGSIKNHSVKTIGKTIPTTYVPARNTVFLSLALAYAETLDADAIFIGANAVDYSGYPDCRPEYIQAYQQLASLATKKGIQGKTIRIEAPLLHLTKAEIIAMGLALYVPFVDTWSCYRGGKKACGKCDSCLLRLKGFQEAAVKDPLPYETVPAWYSSFLQKKNKK
jgi:7-cyano-7-deazaguanine synthase